MQQSFDIAWNLQLVSMFPIWKFVWEYFPTLSDGADAGAGAGSGGVLEGNV